MIADSPSADTSSADLVSTDARRDKNTVSTETDNRSLTEPAATTADDSSQPELPDDALLIVPVHNVVLFPGIVLPINLGRQKSIAAAQEAVRRERPIGILLQRDPGEDAMATASLPRIGTAAVILRYLTGPNGAHHLVCQGQKRFRILEYLEGYPFVCVRAQPIDEPETIDEEIEARVHRLKQMASEALQLLPQAPPDLVTGVQNIDQPSLLADVVASYLDLKPEEKQDILETVALKPRLDKIMTLLGHRLAVLRISQEINEQTQEKVGEHQREYLLREQLKTIQKQLGETDDRSEEIKELGEAIARAKMPEEAEKAARGELKRLERMPEGAAEYSVARTYLDWLIEVPWSVVDPQTIDITEARQILDHDHYGLERIKRRILEFLAVRKLKPEGHGPILCFVGAPGVGKTSLGQSIARATGRKFVRLSLGGVHDESEIRGHRRTYIGALPGNIIQALRRAGSRNPVMMLDEMDKLGTGIQGDPSAALLEVLDPEQNSTFRDAYLSVPFDLSEVLFIGTANMLDTIPGPLRDRMEVIELPGYTEEEKLQIATRYLVDRQLDTNGLSRARCGITEPALRAIIRDYTREAGCRNLERQIGTVFRHVAMAVADGTAGAKEIIDSEDLEAILGPVRFESEVAMRTSVPGVATGLAWTPAGGDILFIEATRMPGSNRLILTGQLGEVMKESAQAALSLVKTRAGALGIPEDLFEKSDIHIHVPAGAIPKDGPSAGVAMFIALSSLLTGRTCRSNLAMTGEISLRGLVLPVGGIKEKVIAAARAGITEVMLPARNRRDFEEIPADARDRLTFHWIERAEEAVEVALEPLPAKVGEAV
ncbi:MAG: endopeptidase La [Rhodospirillales bacterium]|nr:endopeptidase La [Rhodospirillales bacterium]